MNDSKKTRLATAAGVLAVLLVLGGCAQRGGYGSARGITISSEPPGATVSASGRELGTTPLQIVPGDVFPSRFKGTSEDQVGITFEYAGTLTLEKAGCQAYNTEVGDALLSRDVAVKLTCDPNYRPPAPARAVPAPAPTASPSAPLPAAAPHAPAPVAAEPYSERLRRIESLHERGLISDEEYRRVRKRILDEL